MEAAQRRDFHPEGSRRVPYAPFWCIAHATADGSDSCYQPRPILDPKGGLRPWGDVGSRPRPAAGSISGDSGVRTVRTARVSSLHAAAAMRKHALPRRRESASALADRATG
jgi:hypothetical protein